MNSREREIVKRRKHGESFQAIADALGVTRQRVHQIASEIARNQGHIDTTFGKAKA